MFQFTKAHAYGNDFLYVPAAEVEGQDLAVLARAACARHSGVGADGLIVYRAADERPPAHGEGSRAAGRAPAASMRLLNADGSPSEISGNGVRGLAAILAAGRSPRPAAGAPFIISTDAGPKILTLLAEEDGRFTFRAAMGPPADSRQIALDAAGEHVRVVALRVGNPQCVVLGGPLAEDRAHRLGPALEHHAAFPEGTNVSFAVVDAPGRVRILIWERGVGPTEASGTGACGAAVAAAAYGGASRDVEVSSPGGRQRVEWREEGIYLTGWAEIICRGQWLR